MIFQAKLKEPIRFIPKCLKILKLKRNYSPRTIPKAKLPYVFSRPMISNRAESIMHSLNFKKVESNCEGFFEINRYILLEYHIF